MLILQQIVNPVIDLWCFVLIASVIASWLVAFGVVNPRNQVVGMILQTAHAITEPVLRPIRSVLPSIGGIDLSPIVAIIGIRAIQTGINHYLFTPIVRAGL